MSEQVLSISYLNDFLFCPVSIDFHLLEDDGERVLWQDTPQLNGTASHSHADEGTYSTEKTRMQGVRVYCERYDLFGKIDNEPF